jgi:hypothetical protein
MLRAQDEDSNRAAPEGERPTGPAMFAACDRAERKGLRFGFSRVPS